jgi:hypothetical protein
VALASTFFITRTILSHSISTALFCSRPAVSMSSTSVPRARAAVSVEGETASSRLARDHRDTGAPAQITAARSRRRGRCRQRRA